MINEPAIAQLRTLIAKLDSTSPQSEEVGRHKQTAFLRSVMESMLTTGKRYGEVSGNLEHLMRPGYKEYLKQIDNDLESQVKITNDCVDAWFQNGERLAPYYPWRITVILRKEKLFELERSFLAAYCRHFYGIVGSRYEALSARAEKVGAVPTASMEWR